MITITSWHIVLACGKELHGEHIGSFVKVKNRDDILDLYVQTSKGKIYAHREKHAKPKFDFYIHVVNDISMGQGVETVLKCWKLISTYKDKQVIRYVAANGIIRDVTSPLPEKNKGNAKKQ